MASGDKSKKRKKIDWESIEPDWRAGVKSVLQIAADYADRTARKISHTAINKHFKKLGVPRDLSAKVRAKANAIVSASVVSGKVSTETTETDAAIISENATLQATVQLSHRQDIKRNRDLAISLMSELETMTNEIGIFDNLKKIVSDGDIESASKAIGKATSLGARIGYVGKLADTLKVLVTLERTVYNIGETTVAEDPLSVFFEEVAQRIKPLVSE